MLLVAIEDLVAGLAGDAELAGEIGHGFALEQAGHEAQALFHHRTLLPGHLHLPPKSGKCYPCVRYDLSPMSRVAHPQTAGVRAHPRVDFAAFLDDIAAQSARRRAERLRKLRRPWPDGPELLKEIRDVRCHQDRRQAISCGGRRGPDDREDRRRCRRRRWSSPTCLCWAGGDRPSSARRLYQAPRSWRRLSSRAARRKVIAFKKRRRKNSRRKRGHRQQQTVVRIKEIIGA